MEPLKSCPFCGCDQPRLTGYDVEQIRWIECPKCGAKTETVIGDAKAIVAWNRRDHG